MEMRREPSPTSARRTGGPGTLGMPPGPVAVMLLTSAAGAFNGPMSPLHIRIDRSTSLVPDTPRATEERCLWASVWPQFNSTGPPPPHVRQRLKYRRPHRRCMITIMYPHDPKAIETFKGLMDLDKRPVSEKLMLELHEPVDVSPTGLANCIDRCSRKGLYSIFLNRPDRFPAEISFAYRFMDEWFVAYYPALNYFLCEEQQNLLEMREYCHSHGIHVLSIDDAKGWLARHGFEDRMDRGIIAKIRTSDYAEAIDLVTNVPGEAMTTAVYGGGILIDRILRDIARTSEAGFDLRRLTPVEIAKELLSEDLISRRYLRDVQWAVDSSARAIHGCPKDFDDVFYFRLIDDLLSLLREIER